MIVLTTEQQEALEATYVSVAYFVEFAFTSSTVRFTSWNTNLDWGGYTWTGAGSFGSVSEVKESEKLEVPSLDFSLTLADPAIVALGLSAAETYRGKPVAVYAAPMQSGAILGTPALCWSGNMDSMTLSMESKEGSISLRCKPTAERLGRASNIRVNHATHIKQYPTSRGFEYQADLIANPQLWLSKKLQASGLLG
jgi:hypothetical protein